MFTQRFYRIHFSLQEFAHVNTFLFLNGNYREAPDLRHEFLKLLPPFAQIYVHGFLSGHLLVLAIYQLKCS